ncbi:SgcJ/EcaC family oxidoreductase [Actinacidiphila bryophytorum]|uniref:SnoaL-like domain-containing protein n=1 Tax=Actinacidiphila bryophytorum TaxID=1436133 RepID=A0A9W4H311_9ACTN|nr:SgcJ/EcaC family oxidoreductase [Actinacidiphila bryophytorum]MBM9437117.1 SgcJ/EcaC family oxidoreductase [Actinacidiphila bryophytorum]MBN6542052.1 SgcJ/EcaC family oxidoreductase [Actinacidiphila bryophytorum]CAG7646724.1 SnoaL-like domain-containing protein [Actinacidiphila bryophytorum]
MTANQTHTADETAILRVLGGVYDAWDAHDADAFVADYTEDASAILPGSYRASREEIRQSMQAGFSTYLKGSTTTNKVRDIRFLNHDAAVVVSETNVVFPGETEGATDRASIATWVLTRRDGRWLLAAYQNSPAAM